MKRHSFLSAMTDPERRLGLATILVLPVLLLPTGCVRRTVTITTEPPQALVFLNDQEVGRSEVQSDFLWYGDYDVTVRLEGYETLHTHLQIDAPWYQWPGLDFFAEVLWPGWIHDQHHAHFVLTERQEVSEEELLKRAQDMRIKSSPLGQ